MQRGALELDDIPWERPLRKGFRSPDPFLVLVTDLDFRLTLSRKPRWRVFTLHQEKRVMVLGKSALRTELASGRLKVEPFSEELLQPASIDMRLGDQFLIPHPSAGSFTRFGESIPYEEVRTESYILPGNAFVLARTQEVVELSNDLTAFVEGRSSIGRLGLFIQNAGWVDPGFRGSITLELYNGLPHPIELRAGWRVCQLVFVRMEGNSEGGYQGKYQGQIDTTGSRLHQDPDRNLKP